MTNLLLDELRAERRNLIDGVRLHEPSIRRFWASGLSWFYHVTDEARADEDPAGKPPHLSSSATCLESLVDRQPSATHLHSAEWSQVAREFTARALGISTYQWRSEGAAEVYCRVRALPTILTLAGELDNKQRANAKLLVTEAFESAGDDPDRAGLADKRLYDEQGDRVTPSPEAPGYPAHVFLTYWGLRTVEAYTERYQDAGDLEPLDQVVYDKVDGAIAWSRQALAKQTSLILSDAERTDPQQLAYALAVDLRYTGEPLTAGNERYDLVSAGLDAFFRAQLPSGTWPLSDPIFHYPDSGNAYCFPYETLAELLRNALPREKRLALRELLRPYLSNLLAAWHHAERIRVPLDEDGAAYGWTSGHHAFRRLPESWATATVFSYAQMLRCVVGHATVDAAAEKVRIRRPKQSDPNEARQVLSTRGRTWPIGNWTVARHFASLFLHPGNARSVDPEIRDPDVPPIQDDDARSAILFGPPGTGKTTLAEALAGALAWRFVEVQAADFLSEGVDAIPKRAEEIFEALSELDRCVVLFDEIDELIRARTDAETDPFGRFLTTSMLPKIAQLWAARKLIFLVATNHVDKADPAIRRSSRFDAAILIAPPDLTVKSEEFAKRAGSSAAALPSQAEVDKALSNSPDLSKLGYGVLALLRFDQIGELADRIAAHGDPTDSVLPVLTDMGAALVEHDWAPDDQKQREAIKASQSTEKLKKLFEIYHEYLDEERFDFTRRRYLVASSELPSKAIADGRSTDNGKLGRITLEQINEMSSCEDGLLTAPSTDGNDLRDDGLLVFSTLDAASE